MLGKVFTRWVHLPEPHFRALSRMALMALDQPNDQYPAALYWGGRELIARCWPQPFPDGDSEEDRKRRKIILTTVTTVCGELRAEGAIEVADPARVPGPGRRQVFLLTLDNEPTGAIRKMRDEENAARRARKHRPEPLGG